MYKVNIADAKSGLSKLIRAARNGEEVIICDRNVPVVQIVAIQMASSKAKRPLGPDRPGFELSPAFFDPLPDEIQNLFEGGNI